MLLALATACSDGPVQPGPEAATVQYILGGAGQQELPAVVFDDTIRDESGDFHLRIVATQGVLRLTRAGRYEQRVDHTPYIDGQPQPRLRLSDHGVYTQRGDTLAFDSEFIENLRYAGVLRNGELEVEQPVEEGISAVYRYRR
jgi:hypothetical protein